ncbi:hypothetical protein [Rufibacter latericius]|uniref:Uncharacterized protein n=1 Tax=Rufibacter latericius TaxID=2487040 RepID=A0A3M9MKY1_9BACT|nr:hypothetical protein [Rufibacter latericius]RNI25877.1 hypothetical protein EFB08_13610 [Rufibacter latericius]
MLYLLGFLYLDFADRADYLLTHGRHLASRTEAEFEVQLYWTPNFFAEVHFSPARNRNEKITALTEEPFFDLYLEQISLPHLLIS